MTSSARLRCRSQPTAARRHSWDVSDPFTSEGQEKGLTSKRSSASLLSDGEELIDTEDVGFAKLSLKRRDSWPPLEILIEAVEKPWKESDIDLVLVFFGKALASDEAASGIGITYDFRSLRNPSVRILCALASWAAKPEQKALVQERVVACKTAVPAGWKFWATKAAMDAFFLIMPPTCKTFLMTDFEPDCKNVYCFDPPARPLCLPSSGDDGGTGGTGASSNASALAKQEPRWCGCLCRRRAAKETADQRRIRELEDIVKELRLASDATSKRVAILEAAVPWAEGVEQQRTQLEQVKTQWETQLDQLRKKFDWTSPTKSPPTSPVSSSATRTQPKTL